MKSIKNLSKFKSVRIEKLLKSGQKTVPVKKLSNFQKNSLASNELKSVKGGIIIEDATFV